MKSTDEVLRTSLFHILTALFRHSGWAPGCLWKRAGVVLMQMFPHSRAEDATLVGWGVRVMLLSSDDDDGFVARRLAGMGGRVEIENDLYACLELLMTDATGFGLFVMNCDSFGGVEAGQHAVSLMTKATRRVPTMLLSSDCPEQMFPEDRYKPILLRAPLSLVSLRVGFEHALRDRLIWTAAFGAMQKGGPDGPPFA
jgi:hypothetical protein